jgi:hypothetical protein
MTGKRLDHPTISVVVASTQPGALLESCLAILLPQCAQAGAELIVVRADSGQELEHLRATYAGVVFIPAPQASTVAELRALGMVKAHGDIIALLEDSRNPDDAWIETLMMHSPESPDTFDGRVALTRRESSGDWATYFAKRGVFAELDRDRR